MKIVLSHDQWVKIGQEMGWTNVNVLPNDRNAILEVIESLGATRYTIGFRKRDGSYRTMHAQNRVNKFKHSESTDDRQEQIRENHGLILVYDTSVASQLAKGQNFETPEEKEKALRKAYRSIYPESVELIKGRGQTWVVEGSREPENLALLEQAVQPEEEQEPA